MKSTHLGKRVLALGLAFLFAGSSVFALFPQKAHASDPDSPIQVANAIGSFIQNGLTAGATTGLNVKEYALDPIAWAVAKMAIQSMTKSLVNWINSGFNGSPAFVTDLEGHLRAVGDVAAGAFLNKIASDPALKSPFISHVAQGVGLAYYLSTAKDINFSANGYTLNKVTPNDAAFLAGDFSKGGWSAWYAVTMNPLNNPYGAKIQLADDLNVKVTTARNTASVQLNWGQGFYSWCGDVDVAHNGNAGSNGPNPNQPVTVTALKTTDPSGCIKSDGSRGQVQTPGSLLAPAVSKFIGLPADQLVTADEFDEVIGALMSQLMGQVLGSGGLTGISSAPSGGSSFIDQATDPSQSSPIGAGTGSAMSQAVDAQITQVTQYQTNWQKIQAEAQAAQKCSVGGDAPAVATVLTQAQTALTTAATALTKLNQIKIDVANAGNDITKITKAGGALQGVLASPPIGTDIAYAAAQAQDTGDGSTLFSQMKQIDENPLCTAVH